MVHADSASTKSVFFQNGLLQKTWGSRIYPVEYLYDHAGRMTNMLTWQNFNETSGAGTSGSAATKWLYDTSRGWLNQKKYADDTGPSYTYTAAGRLKSRAWVRGIATWYTNNNAGDLWVVNYTDTTPDVTNSYDRRGRVTVILSGATSLTKSYNNAGNLLGESYSGGPLNGITLTNRYDELQRRTNVSLLSPSSQLLSSTAYAYDPASRLLTVTDGTNSATYDYLDNSALVEQIVFATNGTTVMTTTKGYDFVNRLTNTVSSSSSSSVSSFDYKYNSANQRTSVTNVDGSRWIYSYDSMGQVTSGKKYWADGTAVAGQQFEYGFDDIGNRKTTGAGGDVVGANLRYANYTNNNLNQITGRDVPGFVNVLGTAKTNATVTLWGDNSAFSATSRKGEYFRGELAATNTANALWLGITNLAVLNNGSSADIVTNTVGKMFVTKTPEVFYYDLDGNLTNDGRWTYTWDAENRLTKVESLASAPAASKRKVVWEFDGKGRRVRQTTSDKSSGSYVVTEDLKFVADGWRHIAELNATNNALVRSYTWGKDLSGSLDGAGGVGGLLMLNSVANGTHFYAYDGNGNVAALVKATDGSFSQQCEYEPFGKLLRNTGLMAGENKFLFSTKRNDATTDLLLPI